MFHTEMNLGKAQKDTKLISMWNVIGSGKFLDFWRAHEKIRKETVDEDSFPSAKEVD